MRDLARWVPMGLKGETELKGLAWGGVVSLLYSLTFWLNFADAYNELFQYVGNQRVLMEDARMPLFAELLAESRPMAGFWITAACMAALAAWHYAYHYQGSRSIYLMRRLPSPVGAVAALSGPARGGRRVRAAAGGAAPAVLFWIVSAADAAALLAARPMGRTGPLFLGRCAMIQLNQVSKQYAGKRALREGGPDAAPGGDRGPVRGERRRQDHPDEMYPGVPALSGDHHPRRRAHYPPEHRPNLLRHLRALLFPQPERLGPPGFLSDPLFRLPGRPLSALLDFFQLPKGQARAGLSTGQKNQLEVILALSQGADYILMDDPSRATTYSTGRTSTRCCWAFWSPRRTVLLSTHLLEEVEHFISRAVLLRQGEIVGDVSALTLEEEGRSLLDFVKETYHYRADRVSRALSQLMGEEGEDRA